MIMSMKKRETQRTKEKKIREGSWEEPKKRERKYFMRDLW